MKRTIFLTTVVVSSIAVFSVYFAPKKDLKRTINLDHSITVINLTEEKDLDTITSVTATALKIHNITLVLVSLTQKEIDETDYLGYIQKCGGYYLIRLRPGLSKDLIIETISHEMIHCYHNEKGRLKTLYYGIEYDGLVYTPNFYYWDRKYEIIAFKLEWPLKMYIKGKLYKTVIPSGN